MNDTSKIEPVVGGRTPPTAEGAAPGSGGLNARPGLEPLARIEEKTARIEEKFARSEALLLRVLATFEDAMSEFGGLARRADLQVIDRRTRRLPGIGALIVVGILAAVLGAATTIAALKYGIPWPLLPTATPLLPAH
jgi:hypothetical protein